MNNKKVKLLDQVRRAIRVKHYSFKTEKAYVKWIRGFILFHNKRHPSEMGEKELQQYLTWLATKRKVAASTQNQALCAIIFLYRYIIEKPLTEKIDAVRAKKPFRLPIVLSKKEISDLLSIAGAECKLFLLLLYGCGLRLRELLNLRVKDIDFDNQQIIIRDGKGFKDRAVMLPQSAVSLLHDQLTNARILFNEDRATNAPGIFIPYALEIKYPDIGRQWSWYWLFPSKSNSIDPVSKTCRRHHIHVSTVQKAVSSLSKKCQLVKHVTPHVFRHCYATHLLESGCDINSVQKLMGHKHIDTTMIYLHCLESRSSSIPSPVDSIAPLLNPQELTSKIEIKELKNEPPKTLHQKFLYKSSSQSKSSPDNYNTIHTPIQDQKKVAHQENHEPSIPQIIARQESEIDISLPETQFSKCHTELEGKSPHNQDTCESKPLSFDDSHSEEIGNEPKPIQSSPPLKPTFLFPFSVYVASEKQEKFTIEESVDTKYHSNPEAYIGNESQPPSTQKKSDFSISPEVAIWYKKALRAKGICSSKDKEYLKWLKFYHHFCRKYHYQIDSQNSLNPFINKLLNKHQSKANIEAARSALQLFLGCITNRRHFSACIM